MPLSPRTKGIIQHFERQMRLQLDGLAKDIHITNVRLFPLETTQIEVVRRSRNTNTPSHHQHHPRHHHDTAGGVVPAAW
jgi:phosphoenolpyruvate carboxylase